MSSRFMTIDLRGAAEIYVDGEHLHRVGTKSRALFAVLSLSPSYSRTRSFLSTMFWCEKSQQRAQGNLRVELVKIKRLIKQSDSILKSSGDRLYLNKDRIKIIFPEVGYQLLSGIDVNEEPFEEWLKIERANFENKSIQKPQRRSGNSDKELKFGEFPIVSILPFQTQLNDTRAFYFTSIVSELVQEEIRNCGISSTFDHNSIPDNCWTNIPAPIADLFLCFNTYLVDDNYWLFCKIMEPLERKVISSPSVSIPSGKTNIFEGTKVPRFINHVVDTLTYVISMYYTAQQNTPKLAKQTVFAIQEIQKGRKGDLFLAESLLDKAYKETGRGIYLAWKAYLYTYLFGERLVKCDKCYEEKLVEMITLALERESNNPLVLSLIGHVQSFVFHNYDKSLHYFGSALKQKPKLAICYDLSARTQVYTSRIKEAVKQSRYALKLGSNAQYRSNIEISCYMTAFLNGDYDDVIKYARCVLDHRPKYAAVLRYLAASYGLQGDVTRGKESLKELKKIEPDFSIQLLHRHDYPLAGTKSKELLIEGISMLEKE